MLSRAILAQALLWGVAFADCAGREPVSLERIPPYLKRAFIAAEDKRFYSHRGFDLWGLGHAALQNASALRLVRGASTITEQVVRIEQKLPRTLLGRLKAMLGARELERRLSKDEILARYLAQVPYPGDACGVEEGARVLFGRSLSTLTTRELLTLVILTRAPSALDPLKNPKALERREKWFVERNPELAPEGERAVIAREEGIKLLRTKVRGPSAFRDLLRERVRKLAGRNVKDAALFVVENETGKVLAEERVSADSPAIDSVRVPRQAGSTLKPFLYAMAFEQGMSPESRIEDSELFLPVGAGIHPIRNYSGEFYGELPLREALGSSLNTPAVRLLSWTGEGPFFARLQRLGFRSLRRSAEHYGEGIVIGNAEVTLEELVMAYRVLARRGEEGRLFQAAAVDAVTDILLDPDARRHEFSVGGLLQFPIQTAVKTGTSNDHCDAWAVGYSKRFTAGVWFGNLDRSPMREVSGSRGPAWVLRELFHAFEQNGEPAELRREVVKGETQSVPTELRIAFPVEGALLKRDPRIPDSLERIVFRLSDAKASAKWFVDNRFLAEGATSHWDLLPGEHTVRAFLPSGESSQIRFFVR